jgi:alkylation response protein AidB-like acyl-CoA dehydrogenase
MPLPTEEQTILREMAHNWAQRDCPVRSFRELRDSGNPAGFDADTFNTIAQMGWTGAIIPENYGGSDVGYASMGAVLEELGRTLVAAPLIGSAVGAASALLLGGSEEQKAIWLPKIANGETVAALAIDETTRFTPQTISLKAKPANGGYVLGGTKTLVHEGGVADLFVVATRTSGSTADDAGITLFLVPGDAAGLTRDQRKLIDSRGYADVTFTDVKVTSNAVLGKVGHGRAVMSTMLDRATAATAAEAFGLAVQAFETTLDYLKTRTQFGQVIGTFQALQHRMAKMFTDIQLARPCLEAALNGLDQNDPETSAAVSLAKAKVNHLVHSISREMIQLHGGIGMTDAYDAGFYLKRARVLESAYGTTAYHEQRYARLLGV